MAIFDCDVRSISRRDGRSATAAAAYRAGCVIEDARTGERHDYSRRSGVAHTAIVLPARCAMRMERAALWNAAEAAEARKDAKVAREVRVALPHELDRASAIALTERYAAELAELYGVAVDLAVHEPDPRHAVEVLPGVTIGGDARNVHAHLLMTTRELDADGRLGAKLRELDSPKTSPVHVRYMRERWADLANEALATARQAARIDHRALRDRGIDRAPQIHFGPLALQVLRERPAASRARRTWLERRAENEEADRRLAAAAAARQEAQEARDGEREASQVLAHLVDQQRAQERAELARQHAERARQGPQQPPTAPPPGGSILSPSFGRIFGGQPVPPAPAPEPEAPAPPRPLWRPR